MLKTPPFNPSDASDVSITGATPAPIAQDTPPVTATPSSSGSGAIFVIKISGGEILVAQMGGGPIAVSVIFVASLELAVLLGVHFMHHPFTRQYMRYSNGYGLGPHTNGSAGDHRSVIATVTHLM